MFRQIEQAALAAAGASPGTGGGIMSDPGTASGRAVISNVSRRGFIKGAGLVLAIQVLPPGVAHAFKAYPTGAEGMPNKTVTDPLVFVRMGADGTVTITAHRAEMGTGSRTSVPMILADEMEANWAKVRIVQAPGDEPRYGNQDTDGSRSLRHWFMPMRRAGGAARTMLEHAAAAKPTIARRIAHRRARDVAEHARMEAPVCSIGRPSSLTVRGLTAI